MKMTNQTVTLIDAIASGDTISSAQHFNGVLLSKVSELIDSRRQEVAQGMFENCMNESTLNEKVVKQHVEAAMDELNPKEFKTTHGGTVIHHIPTKTSYKVHTLGGPAGTTNFSVEYHPSGIHVGSAGSAQEAGRVIRERVTHQSDI